MWFCRGQMNPSYRPKQSIMLKKYASVSILCTYFIRQFTQLAALGMQHPHVYKAEWIRRDTPGSRLRPGFSAEGNVRPILSKSNWRGLAKPLILGHNIKWNAQSRTHKAMTCPLLPHSLVLVLMFQKFSSETTWSNKRNQPQSWEMKTLSKVSYWDATLLLFKTLDSVDVHGPPPSQRRENLQGRNVGSSFICKFVLQILPTYSTTTGLLINSICLVDI